MYFGVDYHPEQWIFPYGGNEEQPESQWEKDIELMAAAGVNVVRLGEYTWGLCELEDGKYDFDWLERVMDLLARAGIKVVLATPTAAPPLWLARKHPEILPVDERGLIKHQGTRRAVCLNSDVFWSYSKRIVEQLANRFGQRPELIAWQIDNGIGGNFTEASFNEDTRRDWHLWLEAKYETVQRLNTLMGLRHWGQIVSAFDQVPMPMAAPAPHNPALVLDWCRFCSDTIVQFVKMQADILHEKTPQPVTTNLRPFIHRFDHFDLAEVIDFVSIESTAALRSKASDLACEIDMLRSLKKEGIRCPDGDSGFWVMEQKAGNVTWQDVNSTVRPGTLRMFSYQLISRGANALMFFRWRQPRFGNEKFHGAVLNHAGDKEGRVFKEVAHLGEELKMLAPSLKDSKVEAECCILYSPVNDWALQQPDQLNKNINLRQHLQLFYNALHDRNVQVDFARPTEDLSKYKVVFAPSLHLLAGGEADLLKLYVQNGGVLVGTFNTGLVDEHNMAPDTGYPHDLTDLFGLDIAEFDQLPNGEENHLTFKGVFPTSHMHPARLWCDVIRPRECTVLATYTKDFYSGTPAMTMNTFGLGKAIYIGFQSHQHFYDDLITWLRQLCNLHPLLKVPEKVEVALRQRDDDRVFFLLNHQPSPIRLTFYKPMHDYLTGNTFSGNYELQPHGVLVLDEHRSPTPQEEHPPQEQPVQEPEKVET